MAKKYYAVKKGLVPGVYLTWPECQAQVNGYSGAVYKSFATRELAEAFVQGTQVVSSVPNDGQQKEENHTQTLSDKSGAVAYVDGSYHVGTGEFSYGAVILLDGQEICLSEKMTDKELASMRNVAGEIMGAMAAMRYALSHGITEITIVHDYQGIASWCNGEWKANKEGTKQYRDFYQKASEKINIHFQKVKGHSGDHYNDMADRLAKEALGIV